MSTFTFDQSYRWFIIPMSVHKSESLDSRNLGSSIAIEWIHTWLVIKFDRISPFGFEHLISNAILGTEEIFQKSSKCVIGHCVLVRWLGIICVILIHKCNEIRQEWNNSTLCNRAIAQFGYTEKKLRIHRWWDRANRRKLKQTFWVSKIKIRNLNFNDFLLFLTYLTNFAFS